MTLLERVARGDRSAVNLLLERFTPLVWSLARRQIPADAVEDLVQEVFIQVWKFADRFDPERGKQETFIGTIARRRLIDYQRKIGRLPEISEVPEDSTAHEKDLESVDLSDEAQAVQHAISNLSEVQQQVLKLSIVESMTHSQIAELTQLPLGTVKSHVRRGLDRVRRLVAKSEAEEQK